MPYHQNYFYPKNIHKWGGVERVLYLSGWEFRFLCKLDENPNVIRCSANNFSIPYLLESDGRQHNYFIDFYVEMKKEDKVSKMLIEIKPDSQCFHPVKPKINNSKSLMNYNKRVLEYIKNTSKWKASSRYAKMNNMQFYILTEKAQYVLVDNVLTKIATRKYF